MNGMFRTAAAVLLTVTAALASILTIPVARAEENRKTVRPGSPPLLERIAAELKPGEWRPVPTLLPDGTQVGNMINFLRVRRADGYNVDGMGWTDTLVYHKGSILIPLMRDDRERALAIMSPDGKWTRLENVALQPNPKMAERRPYNRWDSDGSYAYFLPRFSSERTGELTRTPLDKPGEFELWGPGIGDSQTNNAPSMCYADDWKRFFVFTAGNDRQGGGKVYSRDRDDLGPTAWHYHGRAGGSGTGARCIWNPVRKELLVGGGQVFGKNAETGNLFAVVAEPLGDTQLLPPWLKPDGTPLTYNASNRRITYHPISGEYLFFAFADKAFYIGDGRAPWRVYDEFQDAGVGPFGPYGYYAPVDVLPGTDVLVFVSQHRGVILHRVKTAGQLQ